MLKKAQKLANVTYSVIAKSCNKILIGKTFWKSVAIPSIVHGVNMINMTETDIEKTTTDREWGVPTDFVRAKVCS